jgi:cbb3-type cytochrome oxidase subunit 1
MSLYELSVFVHVSAVVVGFGAMALIVLIRIVQRISRAPGTTGDRADIGPRQ